MKIKDGAGLWQKIQDAHLDHKPIGELGTDEIELLADILSDHVEADIAPYFDRGHLIIPFGTSTELKWWRRQFSDRERYEFFRKLGIPDEEMHHYMHRRSLDVALGRCDEMGRPLNNEKQ